MKPPGGKGFFSSPAFYLPIAAAAATGSFVLFHFGALRGCPHVSDEVVYIFQAKTLARGTLAAPAPNAPSFFTYLNIIIDTATGKWFGIYPPGWPGVLAPFIACGIPWLANAVVNALALLAIYRLGCEFFGRRAAGLALLLGLLSPFVWVMGASFLSHPLATLLAATALLGPAVGLRRDKLLPIAAGGLSLGGLVLTRPLDGIVIAVALALWLTRARAGKAAALLFAAALPGVAALLLYNRALTGEPFLFPQQLYNPRDTLGFGPGVGKVATWGSVGHTPLKALYNLAANLQALATNLFGWPFVSFAFVPFAYLTRRPRWWRGLKLLTAVAVLFALGYACYWYDGVMYGPRFYYTLLPLWLLGTAAGLINLHKIFTVRRVKWLVPVATAVLFLFSFVVYLPRYVGKLRASYNLMDNAAWTAAKKVGVRNGIILHPPYDRAYPSYGAVFWRNSPWLDTAVIWAKDLGPLNGQLRCSFPAKPFYRYDGHKVTPHEMR